MTTIIALAVLLSALLHASWNALVKGGDDGWLTGTLISFFAAAAGAVAVIALSLWPAPHHWPWLIGSGALHAGYLILLMCAYTYGDLGKVYAIARGTAPLVIVALAGPLVGDVPSWQEVAAILVLVTGVVALTIEPGKFASADARAVILAILTGSMIAAYSLFDAVGIRTIGPELEHASIAYGSWLMIFTAIPVLTIAAVIRRGRIVPYLRANALQGGPDRDLRAWRTLRQTPHPGRHTGGTRRRRGSLRRLTRPPARGARHLGLPDASQQS
jgi:drug/metabolite transporter (DMT)-like permease